MWRYSDELLDEIKSKNDIVDIVSQYVVLKRSGRNFFGLCPFHKEKSPSFSVSPDKQIFHCFGCGVGGNVFHFISKIENVNFKESVELLAGRAGIELPTSDNAEDDKLARLKSRVYEVNSCAAEFYHQNLYKPTAKQIELVTQNFEQIKGFIKEPISFKAKIGADSFTFDLRTGVFKYRVCQEGESIEQNIEEAFANLANYLKKLNQTVDFKDNERE